jgi:hypothetical protein
LELEQQLLQKRKNNKLRHQVVYLELEMQLWEALKFNQPHDQLSTSIKLKKMDKLNPL